MPVSHVPSLLTHTVRQRFRTQLQENLVRLEYKEIVMLASAEIKALLC